MWFLWLTLGMLNFIFASIQIYSGNAGLAVLAAVTMLVCCYNAYRTQ